MAEGGDLPSLKDGSDADFELICTPCSEDNERIEAIKYCQECQEYLCAMCTKHHGRLKATRAHILLDKDNAKQSSFVAKTKCRYHPDRDIEMYCEAHDMVYCTMCIATEHRSCDDVNKIEDKLESCVNQTEIHRVLDETKNALETIKTVVVKQKKNIVSLEEQRNVIQDKLEDVKTSLIEHILKLKKETSDSVDKIYAKTKEELEFDINVSTNMIQNLEKTLEQMQLVHNLDAGQQFIQMKLVKMNLTDANKLHSNSESNGTKSICFTENTDLVTSVMTAVAFGQVREGSEDRKPSKPKQYKMKSKKEVNVKLGTDKTTCFISDVCQHQDGTILLTDYYNGNVKRLDSNYKLKDSCDLAASPRGICFISKNEVAVKMSNNTIQFIDVSNTLSKTRCVDIVHGSQFGLTFCMGELWTSRRDGVNVYSTTGNLVKSIDKNRDVKPIFKAYTQHLAASGDSVLVTDNSDGAVCLNNDGTIRRELRSSGLKYTRGVCVSDDGIVLLCGYHSNNIVMFSSDGKCLGELVAKDAGLKEPINLCYDVNKHSIIVTCRNCDTISVVELRE
ncbi:E3 ubiquitin-protein ligase TRIM71-like [Mercenaria mercenaria]|uniref:E3 ubiquitin-protein ligase TRIM71-like n=1 Tax=Mercenaria mercenaria TaxID=6596 RepID=UPI00234F5173|nr:E3 ubiquitin-protein ligase TRIM71-like [Mercenaria mercenaria]XP_053392070.1 E3 ubiquitin-protein ligase TRIM71-like [Mercenaria mercenaria]